MDLRAFEAELNQKKIRPAYLFSGEQELLKQQALEQLRRAVAGERGELRKLEARETRAADILEAQQNASLFQPVGAVVIREGGRLAEGDKDALRGALETLGGGPPLVFWDVSFDKRNALFAEISRSGAEIEFKTPRRADVRAWVQKAAQKLGHGLAPSVGDFLVELVGNDLLTLRSALEKLSVTVGPGKPIVQETVSSVIASSRSPAMYELSDAISERNGAKAVRLFRKAVDEGEALELLVGVLHGEVRRLLLARELGSANDPKASRLGVMPFKVADLVRQSKAFPLRVLRNALHRLAAIDLALKTGKGEPVAAIEGWIISLCTVMR
jgi:DNA polymerase-3 subunit delta